ncbi:MAG: RAMP superfamily protein [Chloroflexi bacterium]|nr:RAMP superfamily protein [Chloroflexota bacterium]
MPENKQYWLKIDLLSDTTLGRGDGVAGVVDAEVQHDAYGLPYLSGKTLKGLLAATCAELLAALEVALPGQIATWQQSAQQLFGAPGSLAEQMGGLHVGDAQLPSSLQQAVAYDIANGRWQREEVLASLTTLRRQTAMDAKTGAPRDETLRTVRVILRDTSFVAQLDFVDEAPSSNTLALLAACAKVLRRAGTDRNRGRGRIRVQLFDQDPFTHPAAAAITTSAFAPLATLLAPATEEGS